MVHDSIGRALRLAKTDHVGIELGERSGVAERRSLS